MEFLKTHFDKLLLSSLFLAAMVLFLHTIHHTQDVSVVNWLQNTIGQILAALLTLMVGRSMVQKNDNGNGNGKPPAG